MVVDASQKLKEWAHRACQVDDLCPDLSISRHSTSVTDVFQAAIEPLSLLRELCIDDFKPVLLFATKMTEVGSRHDVYCSAAAKNACRSWRNMDISSMKSLLRW